MSSSNAPTAPTLINLPPPPSEGGTPDVPSRSGTPNSATTSMSELSTVAIKDGHRGHLPHHGHSHMNPTSVEDAQRADRISRLAGLERVATARNPAPPSSAGGNLTPGAAAPPLQAQQQQYTSNPPQSYFDATGNPAIGRERSTVGSASATGSVGARTTWAGSEAGDADKMSESQDMDMDTSSVGGMSEEGTGSLVGFGEGARTPARQSTVGSPSAAKGLATPTPATPGGSRDAKMIDGMTYDRGVVDTTAGRQQGAEEAERIVRENMNTTSADRMRGHGPGELGKFEFEK
ncbi:uncharacterized protein LTR77_003292 [Saxophila tyrrhenica]|uniref:Uncharacterized protein n=1 Tax=Saxophila tyrrhenica TaxID=1690608 RepID=A0AAV9PHU9_9PEZI|nr:hypothetical protein LTR77_003292 [Saxophila tyrrhenica]